MDKYIKKLDALWDQRRFKIDWMGMERMLADILTDAELTDTEKVKLSKECIDAYTGRGHFRDIWEQDHTAGADGTTEHYDGDGCPGVQPPKRKK